MTASSPLSADSHYALGGAQEAKGEEVRRSASLGKSSSGLLEMRHCKVTLLGHARALAGARAARVAHDVRQRGGIARIIQPTASKRTPWFKWDRLRRRSRKRDA